MTTDTALCALMLFVLLNACADAATRRAAKAITPTDALLPAIIEIGCRTMSLFPLIAITYWIIRHILS